MCCSTSVDAPRCSSSSTRRLLSQTAAVISKVQPRPASLALMSPPAKSHARTVFTPDGRHAARKTASGRHRSSPATTLRLPSSATPESLTSRGPRAAGSRVAGEPNERPTCTIGGRAVSSVAAATAAAATAAAVGGDAAGGSATRPRRPRGCGDDASVTSTTSETSASTATAAGAAVGAAALAAATSKVPRGSSPIRSSHSLSFIVDGALSRQCRAKKRPSCTLHRRWIEGSWRTAAEAARRRLGESFGGPEPSRRSSETFRSRRWMIACSSRLSAGSIMNRCSFGTAGDELWTWLAKNWPS